MIYEKLIILIIECFGGGIGHALALAFATKNCLMVVIILSLESMSDFQNDQDSSSKSSTFR